MHIGLIVRNVIFINRAPFERLDLKFIDGINVLSSENGRGKTTIMSYIVDALHEMAKKEFSQSYIGHETAWYRVSSSAEMMDSNRISLVYIRFVYQGNNIDYIDLRGEVDNDKYKVLKHELPETPIPISIIMQNMQHGNTCKLCHFFNATILKNELFSQHVATYFPAYRYEMPAYMNSIFYPDKSPFDLAPRFQGYLPNPIEVISGIDNISNWLMDVVLDLRADSDERPAPESMVWRNVCNVLEWAMLAKKGNNHIRFGIGRRNAGTSRVSVICTYPDREQRISPSVSYLSSGEKGLLCIFGEILRQSDHIHPNVAADNIDGLVLVDEIDKHLHIRQQKEALPQLLNKFPNLQFIISSHSPFFNMGLTDECNVPSQIIDLDSGGVACEPRQNKLYSQVYEMMLHDKADFAQQVDDLKQQLALANKTLIITEGKTDIIHINKAKEKLGVAFEYDTIAPDKQPTGDGDVLKLLKQLALTPHTNKIIGIFDCDDDICKSINTPYTAFGNNVYAFKIVPPQYRVECGQNRISIEYLYSDDEVKTMLPNGTRLFFGTEVSEQTNRSLENPDWCLTRSSLGGCDKIVENTGKQAVYDAQGNNYLAKKSDFAQAIADESIDISDASWENFRHIFDIIEAIVKL